jgi:DNA-binding NarL/FixJ family response regulator
LARGCAHAPTARGRRPSAAIVGCMPVRVVVADDNLLFRQGVEEVLSGEPAVDVVGVCEDLPSLEETVEQVRPDVVLTDIRMPPLKSDEGVQFALELQRSRPAVGVIILSQYADPSYALALLEQGSERRGYLLKEHVHDRAQLVSAIESVASGGSVIDATIIDMLLAAKSRAERSPLADLTVREREVLAEIARGKSNAAIAKSLVLSKHAVEKHINSIFLKLNLSDAAEDVSKRVKAALVFLSEAEGSGGREDVAR